MRVLLFFYALVGRKVLAVFMWPIVAYLYFTGGTSRKASKDYLRRIASKADSPQTPSSWQGIKHFYSFALSAFDKIDAWTGRITMAQIESNRPGIFDELVLKKKGAVFIGSHLGNLEVCRALSHGRFNTRINVLVFTQHAVKFNRILHKLNANVGVDLIQVAEVGADLAIMLKERIDNGEVVVIVGDRTSTTSTGRVSNVEFLGKSAPFSQGPFILASLLDCPVYLLFCLKAGNKYRMYFEHLSDSLKFSRKNRQEELKSVISQYANRLEYYCLQYPYQWFNFFDFWCDDSNIERNSSTE